MAQTLGNVAVGAIVKLNENGSPVEYLVIQQGKPPDSMYDESCDGTWLLRKDIAENRVWNADDFNQFENSDIQVWLDSTMFARYDSNIRSVIKQVKIPYRKNGGSGGIDQTGSNGYSCKVFLLSCYELGATNASGYYFPNDGARLTYFPSGYETFANKKRVAYLNQKAAIWWLRSPMTYDKEEAYYVNTYGDFHQGRTHEAFGVRPALIMPTTLLVLDDGMVSITLPSPVSIMVPSYTMAGNGIDITWSSVNSAKTYKLERNADNGGWTQVYEGGNLNYTDAAGNWTSVRYRVSASILGSYGTPKESDIVQVIPASALVISGTDGNLGTIKAPVTYSVTSDTGNQITVTEIINGHERTLTPASGQAIVIPVSMLDPGAGAITIKASVQATSGTVNQTRSWTYTKTTLALPVDPYRVERMQGKECDIFPQTLAEAVMMPDGSSVADKLGGATLEGAAVGAFTSSVTLPFTPDAVWVIYGGEGANSIPPFAMLYPKVRAQISTGNNRSQYVTWDGSTNINSTGNPAQPLNYVALKFGGAS